MTVYAHCTRCRKDHRRGTKIFKEHKDWLGMYIDTSTRSKRKPKKKHNW